MLYDELFSSRNLRIGKFVGIVGMTRNIDVNETRTFLNLGHAWTVYELLK